MDNPLLRSALALAAKNIPIFPCVPGGKSPAIANNFNLETINPDQIRAWWAENPKYNIGFRPEAAGWGVVDTDLDKITGYPVGEENLAALEMEHGELPETLTVRTPSGGLHRYYRGNLPQTVDRIAPCVDTRGNMSYVLFPPSYVEDTKHGGRFSGHYTFENKRGLADVPLWISNAVARSSGSIAASSTDLDLPFNLDRARRFLLAEVDAGRAAVAGQRGNETTFRAACCILDMGVSELTAAELLEEHYNPGCLPAWSYDELEVICANAARYRLNDIGSHALTSDNPFLDNPALAAALAQSAEEASKPKPRSKFHILDEDEQDNLPDTEWLIPGILPAATTALLYGATGSFKSFIALDMAMALTAGVETLGVMPSVTGPVVYAAAEGRNSMAKRRRAAWKIARQIDGKLDFGVSPLPKLISADECEAWIEEVRSSVKRWGENPRLIVLDTAAKMLVGMEENSASDVGKLSAFCDALVDEFGCTVLVLAHTGKNGEIRGSSAFLANFDTLLTIEPPDEDAKRKKFVKFRVVQHKDADEIEHPINLKGHAIAGSLVFDRASAETLAENLKDNPISPAKVGAALRELGAIGMDKRQATEILANQLTETTPTEPLDQIEGRVKAMAKRLKFESQKTLRAYAHGQGRELSWWTIKPEDTG